MKFAAAFLLLVATCLGQIVSPPKLKAGPAGIELSVTAEGTQPFTYQWFSGVSVLVPVAGATQSVLILKPPYVPTLYRCVVGNKAGSTTSGTVRVATTTQADAADVTVTVKVPKP